MSPSAKSANEFTRYYEEHKNAVLNYIFYRVSFDRDIAEDLTSEIFLKAFEHLESYDRKRSFKTWIFTIAHNHLINFLTSRKTHISLDESIEISDQKKRSLGDEFDSKTLVGKILKMVDLLPESQRELVIMRYVNDLNNNEIASVLGKDEGAIRTALSRAISMLRNHYTSSHKLSAAAHE